MAGVMVWACLFGGVAVEPLRTILFVVLFVCGAAMAYGFLLILTSLSIWFMRNQSLFEMWWLFTTLMRYPREIYQGAWAWPVGWIFSFVIPIMLVTNIPARTMVESMRPSAGEFLFTLAGFGVLIEMGVDAAWAHWVAWSLGVGALALLGFIVAQRAGLLRLVEWLALRLSGVVSFAPMG